MNSHYDNTNKIVIDYITKYMLKNNKILDIGCWMGKLGENLNTKEKVLIDGIDINRAALKIAKRRGYRYIYKRDLNRPLNLSQKYDFIICADLLEHLQNPNKLLTNIKYLMKPETILIVSLPNIAFFLYRLKLLFGIWDYEKWGVMDETHLHFYTLKTMKTLLKSNGYKILEFSPYNEVNMKYYLLKILGKIYPSLFSLQFVFLVQKK